MKVEREQAQPQLYGTSYFFVRNTLTGQLRALRIWEQTVSPDHRYIQRARGDYASLLRTLGRDEEARKLEEGP